MTELRSILDEAARQGLISPEAGGRLLPFLAERGVTVIEARPAMAAQEEQAWSDTETPRFVRGFHDVLITIGVVVALGGLWGLAALYAVLPAIIVLSEILVRRQRLALPAVSLTIALFCWTFLLMSFFFKPITSAFNGAEATQFVAGFPIILGAYYVRYRVPLALALCIMSALAFVLTLLLRLMQWASGDPQFFANHPVLLAVVCLVCALGLFATALYFDLGDRMRRTTRSDIAFWLHLGAAPALLFSVRLLISFDGNLLDVAQTVSIKTPIIVISVGVLMLIGLVIDRRAFVTSGLLSLGFAIYGIFRQGSATVDTYIFTTLIVVGAIVLVIGTGWMPLRRIVLRALPAVISQRLPPAVLGATR
jgi:hypothetical protein